MFLLEGGVGGHMSHLYDNPRLTFANIKKILQDAAEGRLEGTEKTDGQNLFISFSVPEQKAKGARNKSNIKDGGLDASDLAKKFAGRGPLEKTFSEALAAFEEVVREMPKAQQIQIFGPNTNVYFSAEIIDPRSSNLINYDTKTLAIHRNGAEFSRETGDPIEIEVEDPNYPGELIKTTKDVSRNAELLDSLLKDKQEEIKKRNYGVEMDAINVLKGLEENTALEKALDELEKEISSEGISDNQTILEYVMAKISNWFVEQNMKFDEEVEKKILQKILLSDPSYRYAFGRGRKLEKEWNKNAILKEVPPEQKEDANYAIDNASNILKGAIAPIESIIHDFSVEMLKSLKSIFILDNEKELQRQRKEVEKAIKAIQASGSEEAMLILQKQMEKLKSIENISTAAEGFVFDYDGHTYKFTGNFAPMNQLLGLFKYGRKGIPAMEKIDESLISKVYDIILEELGSNKLDAIYLPGGFKPPHRGHWTMVQSAADKYPNVPIYIVSGKVSREGITLEDAEKIWDIYIKESGLNNVELVKVDEPIVRTDKDGNPIIKKDGSTSTSTNPWEWIKKNVPGNKTNIGIVYSEKDKNYDALADVHLGGFEDLSVTPIMVPACPDEDGSCALSATNFRQALRNRQGYENFIPEFASDRAEDILDVLGLSKEEPENELVAMHEVIFSLIEEVIEEKETKVSKAGQERVANKIASMTRAGECKENADQCAAIAYSYEEQGKLEEDGDLEEASTAASAAIGSGPFPGLRITRKKSKRSHKSN